jgi:hypothetical protein
MGAMVMARLQIRVRPALAVLMLAACGVPVPTVNYETQARLLSMDGYRPVSPKVLETLVSGEKLVMETKLLEGECYAILATRDDGAGTLSFSLWKHSKKIDEKVETAKAFAVIAHCPAETSAYGLQASLSGAESGVVVGVWKKEGPGGAGGKGTCDAPFPLEIGKQVKASTKGLGAVLQGPCIPGEAPEAVYRVEVEEAGSFFAQLDASFDGGLYVLEACGPESDTLACSDDTDLKSGASRVSVSVSPGVYYLVVDGFGTMAGEYTLTSGVIPAGQADALCAEAPPLVPGQEVKGTTKDLPDTFHGSCAEGSKGPDRIYAVEIAEPSRARFVLETPDFDGVLHLVKGCPGPDPEIGCNDDFGDNKRAMIQAELQPGSYTLVVDGFDGMEAGPYTLRMDTFGPSTPKTPDDACGSAAAIEGIETADDQVVALKGSTFKALDDVQPACAPSPGGPDLFRTFHLEASSVVSVEAAATDFPGIVFSVLEGCGGESLACQVESLETTLPAGDFVLAVDSLGGDQLGDFELTVRIEKVEMLRKKCAAGPPLANGKLLKGTTAGKGSFTGSCGGLGYGPESVHVLKLQKKSAVRIEVNPEGFDSVIYIRKTCEEKSSEAACNDDAGSTTQSVLETTLEKGTWYVVVDGCKDTDAGKYTIRAIVKTP